MGFSVEWESSPKKGCSWFPAFWAVCWSSFILSDTSNKPFYSYASLSVSNSRIHKAGTE